MIRLVLVFFVALLAPLAFAQDEYAADTADPDALIEALYDVISGPVGEARDWDRFRALFHPDARLFPTQPRPDGSDTVGIMTPEDYIESNGPALVRLGFTERELARRTERFGPLLHAWSSYEATLTAPEGPQTIRGVNSIQLVTDGARWWILSLAWAPEAAERTLPDDLH